MKDSKEHIIVVSIAGVFAGVATLLSAFHIIRHLANFSNKNEQIYIVRILGMIPIYAFSCWISLELRHVAVIFATLREIYEAYVMWSFMELLIAFMGGRDALIPKLAALPVKKFTVPFCCIKYKPGLKFLFWCKRAILQYSVIRPLSGLAALILALCSKYEDGKLNFTSGYLYLTVIDNISITIAMFGLISFYNASKTMLVGKRPVAKFLCIKGVLFFSFWQGVLLAILQRIGLIKGIGSWDVGQVATGIQNFAICIEMTFFAVIHMYSFSVQPYIVPNNRRVQLQSSAEPLLSSVTEYPQNGATSTSEFGIAVVVPHDSEGSGNNSSNAKKGEDKMRLLAVATGEKSSTRGDDNDHDSEMPTLAIQTTSNETSADGDGSAARKNNKPILKDIRTHMQNVREAVIPTDFFQDTVDMLSFKELRKRKKPTVSTSVETTMTMTTTEDDESNNVGGGFVIIGSSGAEEEEAASRTRLVDANALYKNNNNTINNNNDRYGWSR